MKLAAALMLILALGLSAVHGLDFGEEDFEVSPPLDVEDFMDDLLNEDGDDEIVDMDDALQKYRMLKSIARIVAEGEAMDLMNPKKRFIGGIWNKIKDAVKKAANKVGDFFKDTWDKAKNAFQKVTDKIDFKSAVNKLIPYIHSGMTVSACQAAVSAAAGLILGPAAAVAGAVSRPLCNAGLAKLEQVAG